MILTTPSQLFKHNKMYINSSSWRIRQNNCDIWRIGARAEAKQKLLEMCRHLLIVLVGGLLLWTWVHWVQCCTLLTLRLLINAVLGLDWVHLPIVRDDSLLLTCFIYFGSDFAQLVHTLYIFQTHGEYCVYFCHSLSLLFCLFSDFPVHPGLWLGSVIAH